MSESDVIGVMNKLNTRAKCPTCGKWNKCAMEEGKSVSACWCMNEPPKDLPTYQSCLCRTCYHEE